MYVSKRVVRENMHAFYLDKMVVYGFDSLLSTNLKFKIYDKRSANQR